MQKRAAPEEAETGSREAKGTFEVFAPVYDAFTAHHNYDAWMAELLPGLERHGLAGDRLLDVGCGTGKSFIPMLERWRVTACDVSPAMIEIARSKVGGAARLEVADMRKLPRFGRFDLVWALDDALNYLQDREELNAALAGMRNNLTAHGLLMFDLNTLLTYRTSYAKTTVVEREGLRFTWRGLTQPDVPAGSACEARLEVERSGEIASHRHHQRHFPEAEVVAALESTGFETLNVFGQHEDGIGLIRPLDEALHTKAVYIARSNEVA